jgi:hypothetical protein
MSFDLLRRRRFITLLGGAAAWPLAARAQQPTVPAVGFLHGASEAPNRRVVAAFLQGLGETWLCRGEERHHRVSLTDIRQPDILDDSPAVGGTDAI